MARIKQHQKCARCGGTGKSVELIDPGNPSLGTEERDCKTCVGTGFMEWGEIDITALIDKLDAIKAMLDSPVLGMQKMSSNLDDIMVKLDV